MAPSSQFTYVKDERVLCFHHELLYEAKILDSRPTDLTDKKSLSEYYVHYKGWKNTWDDWVPEDRLRKLTDDNKELAKNLKKEMDSLRQRAAPKATAASSKKKLAGSDLSSGRGSEERHSSVPATGRGQKRGRDYEIEKVGDNLSHFDVHSLSSEDPGLESYLEPYSKRPKTTTRLSPRSKSAPPMLGLPALSKQDLNTKSPNSTENGDKTAHKNSPVGPKSHLVPPDLGFVADPSSIPPSIASTMPTTGTEPNPSARNILQPKPGAQNTPKGIRTYHQKYLDVFEFDSRNARKALFFQDQDPDKALMLAGIPAEAGIQGPDPKGPLFIGAASAKRFRKKKNVVNTSDLQEEAFHSRPSVRIPISQQLKNILVDDWENVTKSLSLVPLPSSKPANAILTEYFDQEKGNRRLGSAEADLLEEVVAGMREYFDKCLGRILLYRFEREQYSQVRQSMDAGTGEYANKAIGDIYGAEHLCRLFVSLPELIAQTNMDQQSVNRLREELTKMTLWLGNNLQHYFLTEYQPATHDYIERARGV